MPSLSLVARRISVPRKVSTLGRPWIHTGASSLSRVTPRARSSPTRLNSVMPTTPSLLPLQKTRSSMVSKSCPVPSRMLHHLPSSPRLRPLPIYVISLKRGAFLIHRPPTRPASCPWDVQGCPTWSLQGWPILCYPQAFSLQHQFGLHHLFLPQPSEHLDLYNFLAQFRHVGSPSLQPPCHRLLPNFQGWSRSLAIALIFLHKNL
jgi:hypothetical protein